LGLNLTAVQKNIIEITNGTKMLSKNRGHLVITDREDKAIEVKVPLDTISSLVCYSEGLTITNQVISALMAEKANLVFCNENYLPVSILMPLDGNFEQTLRMNAQIESSKALKNQLWQKIIKAKLSSQGAILDYLKIQNNFSNLVSEVQSADKTNVEARAASIYFKKLYGDYFVRDRNEIGINSLLNYGYTILRSYIARLLVASGLHPSIGLHHKNRFNHMCLVDDLMEPFRPVIDLMVHFTRKGNCMTVTNAFKKSISNLAILDFKTDLGRSIFLNVAERFINSVSKSMIEKKALLELPSTIIPINISEIRILMEESSL
jgi:CRISPR-associated protein Cas1